MTTAAAGSRRGSRPLVNLAAIEAGSSSDSTETRTAKARALGVPYDLIAGAHGIQAQHPDLWAHLITWPDRAAAIVVVRSFMHLKSGGQQHSRWELASRLAPADFIRLFLSLPSVLAPTMTQLSDALLQRAAQLPAHTIRHAFVGRTTKGGPGGPVTYRPKPSAFFPIDPKLDTRILGADLETDIAFLTELAACRPDEQEPFFTRWITDSPATARAWFHTPKWKRPLLHRCDRRCTDPEAHAIWTSFDFLRGRLMGISPDAGPRQRQSDHPQSIGSFFQHYSKFAFPDRPRWREVYWSFGFMLSHGKDIGDCWTPPWPVRRP